MVWTGAVVGSLMGIPTSSRESRRDRVLLDGQVCSTCICLEILQTASEKIVGGGGSSSIEQAQKDSTPRRLDYVKPVDKGPYRMVAMGGWSCQGHKLVVWEGGAAISATDTVD